MQGLFRFLLTETTERLRKGDDLFSSISQAGYRYCCGWRKGLGSACLVGYRWSAVDICTESTELSRDGGPESLPWLWAGRNRVPR